MQAFGKVDLVREVSAKVTDAGIEQGNTSMLSCQKIDFQIEEIYD